MSLPLEIWHTILESIPQSDKHTLLSVALVSRVAYAAVLPLLYFDVQITGHEKQERFYEWIQSDNFNPSGYVREFTVIITHGDIARNHQHPHTYLALDARLARMQRLHKLKLMLECKVGTYTAVMADAQPSEDTPWSLPELRELRVDGNGIVKPDFLRFLSRCPAVESLEIPQWKKMPSPPADILINLRQLSGNSATALAFLPGRHVEELELTSDLGIMEVFSYLISNPDSAARIWSMSLPSPFYPTGPIGLENMLVLNLPHLKELRLCLNRLKLAKPHISSLKRLEKLVFYIGGPLKQGDVRAQRLADSLKDTRLGMGSTKPCLEFRYRTDNTTSQWRRTADGAGLELAN
ncbi:hypothetical protein CYLTODRAFT_424531, partial [Cylindrobasidium torrendii FP15055 ss-10]